MLCGRVEVTLDAIVCLVKVNRVYLNICLLYSLQRIVGSKDNQVLTSCASTVGKEMNAGHGFRPALVLVKSWELFLQLSSEISILGFWSELLFFGTLEKQKMEPELWETTFLKAFFELFGFLHLKALVAGYARPNSRPGRTSGQSLGLS